MPLLTTRSKWIVAFCLCALFAATSSAQQFELTPFVGYRFGGEIDEDYGVDFFDPFDLELQDGESYGLSLGFPVSRHLQIELLYSHQETALEVDLGFFNFDFFGDLDTGDIDLGNIFGDRIEIADIDVDYYHIGLLYEWTPGQVHPFIVGSVGGTEISPGVPGVDDGLFPSLGFGGGLKIFFSENFGLRLEARAFTTLLDEDNDDLFCDDFGCFRNQGDDLYLYQGEARAGLIFAF